jgi:solute carrier family 25 (mitochondrial S-adenosylmethionine transporter), member 26
VIQAGSLAALSVDILIYPLDTIKTRIQDPSYTKQAGKPRFSGLYQGVGSVVAVTLPAAALFFTTYEGVKNVLLPPGWEDESADTSLQRGSDASHRRARVVGSHALASATAELASCVILTPAEMIKQRAQVARSAASPPSSSSTQHHNSKLGSSPTARAFRETFLSASSSGGRERQQLGKQLWRGYLALASRNLPYTAIQFPLYEHFRAELSVMFGLGKPTADGREKKVPVAGRNTDSSDGVRLPFQKEDTPGQAAGKKMTRDQEILWSGVSSAFAGAGAGSFAALVTTPVDVAKTRIMLSKTGNSSTSTVMGGGAPQGVFSTMRGIWVTEGVRGVMKGGLLRCAWTALGAGVYLSSYETGRIWFRENYL